MHAAVAAGKKAGCPRSEIAEASLVTLRSAYFHSREENGRTECLGRPGGIRSPQIVLATDMLVLFSRLISVWQTLFSTLLLFE